MSLVDEIANIDPRIDARRREVAHAGYRRRRRWWILALVLAMAAVAGWFWARANLFEETAAPVVPQQRAPVAVVAGPDGAALGVDADGWVLGPPGEGEALAPVGGFGQVTQGSQLPPAARGPLQLAAALTPALLERVTGILPGPDGQVVMGLQPSGEVLFGPVTDVDAKLRSLETVFAQVVEDCLATVDVRVAHQVAIRRDPACGTPSPSQP